MSDTTIDSVVRVSGPINAAGLEMTLETGRFAQLADGAVTVRVGDTTVLSTVCTSKPREGIDFFPLTVDVEERSYAAGKIPGSFFRREGRPGRARDPHRAPDRPAAAPVVPRRLPQRGPGHRHRARCRPGEPARRRVDQRRVGGAHRVGHPVQRSDRRGAPRAPRRRSGSRTRRTKKATRRRSRSSSPVASSTTATSRS